MTAASWALVVAVLAVLAATALLMPGPPRLGHPPGRTSRRGTPVLGLAAIGGLGGTLWPGRLLLVAVLLAAVAAGLALVRRRRRQRAAVAVADRVLETCELLGDELAAGRPPEVALRRAAQDWPPLTPAADAVAWGADVPEALRHLAELPGAEDLRLLGAAWQVARQTGQGLATTVAALAEELRSAQATRRVVQSELASARASARLVAALPFPALLLAGGAGADPWHFLLDTPVGVGCLALGLGFVLGGLWWIEAIAESVWRSR